METRRDFTIRELQAEARRWREKQFPEAEHERLVHCTLGVCEEAGELSRAVLKFRQAIRGYDEAKTDAEIVDAAGDLVIYLMGVCDAWGIQLQDAVETTLESVVQRDWQANRLTGRRQ